MKIEHTYRVYDTKDTVFAEHIDTKIDGLPSRIDCTLHAVRSFYKELDKAMLHKLTIEQLEAAKKLIEEVINEKQSANF